LKGRWIPHDTRDALVDFVKRWSSKAELAINRLVRWIGITMSKYVEGDLCPLF